MLIIMLAAIVLVAVFILIFTSAISSSKKGSSRYSQTRSWVDFDPGVDEDKVGDLKYPTAGIDSILKQEFLDDLTNDNVKK